MVSSRSCLAPPSLATQNCPTTGPISPISVTSHAFHRFSDSYKPLDAFQPDYTHPASSSSSDDPSSLPQLGSGMYIKGFDRPYNDENFDIIPRLDIMDPHLSNMQTLQYPDPVQINTTSNLEESWQLSDHFLEEDCRYFTCCEHKISYSYPGIPQPTFSGVLLPTFRGQENLEQLSVQSRYPSEALSVPASSSTSSSPFRGARYCIDIAISPSGYTTSDSSPPSSPLLSPEIKPQPVIPIHQPYPCRRIPIISLSEIASACDGNDYSEPTPDSEASQPSFPSSPMSSDSWPDVKKLPVLGNSDMVWSRGVSYDIYSPITL